MKQYVNTVISSSPVLLSFPHQVASEAPVLSAAVITVTQNYRTVNGRVFPAADSTQHRTHCAGRTAQSAEYAATQACPVQPGSMSS